MAQNLRRKLTKDDTLVVYDVRGEAVDRFVAEEEGAGVGGAKVEKVGKLEEVVDGAVSYTAFLMGFTGGAPI